MTESAALYLVDTGDEIVETTIRPADDEWVDSKTAARILCITHTSFGSGFRPGNAYWQVGRVLRGSNGALNARGQGHLFKADDLRRIIEIRQVLKSNTRVAAKVFAAQRLGQI